MLFAPKHLIWLSAAFMGVAAAANAEPDVAKPASQPALALATPEDIAAVGEEDRRPVRLKVGSAQSKLPDKHQSSAESREQIRREIEPTFLRSPSFDPDDMIAGNRRKTLCQFVCPR